MHVNPYGDMTVTLKYYALSVGLCIQVTGIHLKQSHYGSCMEQHQQKLSACQGKLILLLLPVAVVIAAAVAVARGGGVKLAAAR